MQGFYLIKLKSRRYYVHYDVGIKIPTEFIDDMEAVLKDRDHEKVFINEDIDFSVEDELSYLYNLLQREKDFYNSSWWTGTEIDMKYCRHENTSYMPREEAERVLQYVSGKKFQSSTSDSFLFMVNDIIGNRFPLNIKRDEAERFRRAYKIVAGKIEKIDKTSASLEEFAKKEGFKLKSDEHILKNGKLQVAKSEEDDYKDKPYVGLE